MKQLLEHFLLIEFPLPPSFSGPSVSSAKLRLRFERKDRRRCSEYIPLVDANDRELSEELHGISLEETVLAASSP